jgi:hypothetical protein
MRLVILVLVVLAAPAVARADEMTWNNPPGMAAYPAPPTITRDISYAHQTLISDGIAAVMITAGFLKRDPDGGLALFLVGLDVYGLGAPIVHLGNGQIGNGFKSLGVRLALPMLGAMLGGQVGPKDQLRCADGSGCSSDRQSSVGLAIGLGAGALAAVVIDAHYFAHKQVVELAPQFAPTVSYNRTGLSVGFSGSF